jgi:branched-chain amino acid transport system ATP-binding protein
MNTPLVHMEHAFKSFGGVHAVKDVNLKIDSGGVIALVGPNGAGKSTLFDLMTGVQRLDGGRRVINGRDMTRARSHWIAAEGISRTFQKVRVFPSMTLLDNVIVGGLQKHRNIHDATEAAHVALSRMGLHDRSARNPSELTLIDRKRLEMARALASGPSLLLLDEVMTGLTPREVEEAVQLIHQLTDEGVTVLLVEHLLKVVMRISQRVLVLDHGQLIADGTPGEIQRNPAVIEAYIGASRGETDVEN